MENDKIVNMVHKVGLKGWEFSSNKTAYVKKKCQNHIAMDLGRYLIKEWDSYGQPQNKNSLVYG